MEELDDRLNKLRIELEFYFMIKTPFKLFISDNFFNDLKDKFPEIEKKTIFGIPFDIADNLLIGDFFIIPLDKISFFES